MPRQTRIEPEFRSRSGWAGASDFGIRFHACAMFGEFALYADGVVVALVCNNILYVKIAPASKVVRILAPSRITLLKKSSYPRLRTCQSFCCPLPPPKKRKNLAGKETVEKGSFLSGPFHKYDDVVGEGFSAQTRRERGAYPQGSVTSEPRRQRPKEPARPGIDSSSIRLIRQASCGAAPPSVGPRCRGLGCPRLPLSAHAPRRTRIGGTGSDLCRCRRPRSNGLTCVKHPRKGTAAAPWKRASAATPPVHEIVRRHDRSQPIARWRSTIPGVPRARLSPAPQSFRKGTEFLPASTVTTTARGELRRPARNGTRQPGSAPMKGFSWTLPWRACKLKVLPPEPI